jgi:hypothetical protein
MAKKNEEAIKNNNNMYKKQNFIRFEILSKQMCSLSGIKNNDNHYINSEASCLIYASARLDPKAL